MDWIGIGYLEGFARYDRGCLLYFTFTLLSLTLLYFTLLYFYLCLVTKVMNKRLSILCGVLVIDHLGWAFSFLHITVFLPLFNSELKDVLEYLRGFFFVNFFFLHVVMVRGAGAKVRSRGGVWRDFGTVLFPFDFKVDPLYWMN